MDFLSEHVPVLYASTPLFTTTQKCWPLPCVATCMTGNNVHVHTTSLVPLIFPLQAIERVAMPGSDDVYTVVNKSAPGIKMTSQAPRQDPSPPPKRGREGRVVDPPYVNQAAIPSNAPPTERPTVYRKSVKVLEIHCNTCTLFYTCMYIHVHVLLSCSSVTSRNIEYHVL